MRKYGIEWEDRERFKNIRLGFSNSGSKPPTIDPFTGSRFGIHKFKDPGSDYPSRVRAALIVPKGGSFLVNLDSFENGVYSDIGSSPRISPKDYLLDKSFELDYFPSRFICVSEKSSSFWEVDHPASFRRINKKDLVRKGK